MTVAVGHQDPAFVHEAFLYRGPDEFLHGTLQFIQDGVEAGEPVFVVLNAEKIARLHEALGLARVRRRARRRQAVDPRDRGADLGWAERLGARGVPPP